MNPIFEDRIIPPVSYGYTPANTKRKHQKNGFAGSFTDGSRGYGTMKSRDLEAPMDSEYADFEPPVTSTRQNSFLVAPIYNEEYVTPRRLRKNSDSSIDIPLAPPCSIDGNLDDDYSDDDVFINEDEDLPQLPPSLVDLEYYNCQLCDEVFYRRDRLEQHLQCHMIGADYHNPPHMMGITSRPRLPIPMPVEPSIPSSCTPLVVKTRFKCQVCGKKYRDKLKLRMHVMKLHKPDMEIIMVL